MPKNVNVKSEVKKTVPFVSAPKAVPKLAVTVKPVKVTKPKKLTDKELIKSLQGQLTTVSLDLNLTIAELNRAKKDLASVPGWIVSFFKFFW